MDLEPSNGGNGHDDMPMSSPPASHTDEMVMETAGAGGLAGAEDEAMIEPDADLEGAVIVEIDEDVDPDEVFLDAPDPAVDADTEDVPISESSDHPVIEALPIEDHPGFASPPTVTVSDDQLQVSAMGHSARDGGEDTAGPDAEAGAVDDSNVALAATTNAQNESEDRRSVRSDSVAERASANGQSAHRELDSDRALATQHQDSANGKQKQDQSVERLENGDIDVKQKQDQETADGDLARQENEITISEREDGQGVDVETHQSNKAPKGSSTGDVQQINYVKVLRKNEDCASCTCSAGSMRRPKLQKKLLEIVHFQDELGRHVQTPSPVDGDEEAARLRAPTVMLSFGDEKYALFRQYSADGLEDDDEANLATKPLIFSDADDHRLYYEQVETLIGELHSYFPETSRDGDELVLTFPDLGLELPEDSVWVREISLYDLDRIHVGGKNEGRLHIQLASRPRFVTDFNNLVRWVRGMYDPDFDVEKYEAAEEEGENIDELDDNEDEQEEPEQEGQQGDGSQQGDDEEEDETAVDQGAHDEEGQEDELDDDGGLQAPQGGGGDRESTPLPPAAGGANAPYNLSYDSPAPTTVPSRAATPAAPKGIARSALSNLVPQADAGEVVIDYEEAIEAPALQPGASSSSSYAQDSGETSGLVSASTVPTTATSGDPTPGGTSSATPDAAQSWKPTSPKRSRDDDEIQTQEDEVADSSASFAADSKRARLSGESAPVLSA